MRSVPACHFQRRETFDKRAPSKPSTHQLLCVHFVLLATLSTTGCLKPGSQTRPEDTAALTAASPHNHEPFDQEPGSPARLARIKQARDAVEQASWAEIQPEYLAVIIGAGVHGSILASHLSATLDGQGKLQAKSSNVLLINDSEFFSVFDRTGSLFHLNSPGATPAGAETGRNLIPGAPVQLPPVGPYLKDDFRIRTAQENANLARYPRGKDIGELLALSVAASVQRGMHVRLNTKMTHIEEANCTHGKGHKLTLVQETPKRTKAYSVCARVVIFTTGLGTPLTPDRSDGAMNSGRLLSVNRFFSGLEDLFQAHLNKPSPSADAFRKELEASDFNFIGKNVALIGTGDGAKTALEILAAKGPSDFYNRTGMDSNTKANSVTWFGQKATSNKDFLDAERLRGLNENFALRYQDIEQLFFMASQNPVNGGSSFLYPRAKRVKKIRMEQNEQAPDFRKFIIDTAAEGSDPNNAQTEHRGFDLALYQIGYHSSLPGLLAHALPGRTLRCLYDNGHLIAYADPARGILVVGPATEAFSELPKIVDAARDPSGQMAQPEEVSFFRQKDVTSDVATFVQTSLQGTAKFKLTLFGIWSFGKGYSVERCR